MVDARRVLWYNLYKNLIIDQVYRKRYFSTESQNNILGSLQVLQMVCHTFQANQVAAAFLLLLLQTMNSKSGAERRVQVIFSIELHEKDSVFFLKKKLLLME